jgi:aldose 1-epimerase
VARTLLPVAVALTLLLPIRAAEPTSQARYAVREASGGIRIIEDRQGRLALSVAPHLGNNGYSLTVAGHEVLVPGALEKQFRGIPFMGPWANRLDEQAFYANGRRFAFDMNFGNVRGERPIHGFLQWSPHWKVVNASADAAGASVTSRLEFSRYPEYLAQFPFAHAIEMTYRLSDGAIEVATKIENQSAEPMPVSVGYHPYFTLTDSSRDDWTVSIGARREWVLSPEKLPTGETRPIEQSLRDPQQVRLREFDLDHVFGDLIRNNDGRAVMSVKGKAQQIDVLFGPNYRAAVIYAPSPAAAPTQDRNFICFEPMAAITNAMNLAHRGVYKELQSIPPGGVWQESFWIRPSEF